jgi:hypothetical protein
LGIITTLDEAFGKTRKWLADGMGGRLGTVALRPPLILHYCMILATVVGEMLGVLFGYTKMLRSAVICRLRRIWL